MIEELNFSMAIRFYTWKGPWLSIGKNQHYIPQRWLDLATRKKVNLVKRPSGGSAVLHCGGLTYSLIWNSPPKKRQEAYLQASQWIIRSFSELGIPLLFGNQATSIQRENCFSTASAADLIDTNGQKRIGSAQLWKRGKLLQHGEILLNPPSSLWSEIFQEEAPQLNNLKLEGKSLEGFLLESIERSWPDIKWEKKFLSSTDYNKVIEKSKDYFFELNS